MNLVKLEDEKRTVKTEDAQLKWKTEMVEDKKVLAHSTTNESVIQLYRQYLHTLPWLTGRTKPPRLGGQLYERYEVA